MTTQTTDYDAPAVWAPRLIAWAEKGLDHYEAAANVQRERGHQGIAADYLALAAQWQRIADRARVRLVDISTLSDVDPMDDHITEANALTRQIVAQADEPPKQLVPFVDWLRARISHILPGLSTETWQAIGCLILMARGIRP